MPELPFAKTDVLVLVGGQGKRLRPVVADKPKPMADIAGRPFLDLLLDYVAQFGARRFILAAGYKAESIRAHYRHPGGAREVLVSCEDEPLGTGGAVKNAEGLLQSDPFLVLNGDSFCPMDLPAFLTFHFRKKAVASVALVSAANTQDFGTVELDESQRIISFAEKRMRKERAFINAGIYLFGREMLRFVPEQTKCSLEFDVFPKLVGEELYGFGTESDMIDIGTPERYRNAVRILGPAAFSLARE